MPFTGWKSPSANALITAGDVAWTNPANAYASDESRTVATSLPKNTGVSDTQRYTGFGFSASDIPAGKVVVGIEVQVECLGSDTGLTVYIRPYDATIGAYANEEGATIPTTEGVVTLGGFGQKFGQSSIGRSDILAATFGVQVRAANTATGTRTAEVDHIQVRVEYDDADYYPFVADVTNTINTTDGTSFDVNLPSTVDPDDLLLMLLLSVRFSSPSIPSLPTDFYGIFTGSQTGPDGNLGVRTCAKKAVGNEDGTTVTVTTSSTTNTFVAKVLRIKNWRYVLSGAIDYGGYVQGVGSSGGPGSITIDWGAQPALNIANCFAGDTTNQTLNESPSGYPTAHETKANSTNPTAGIYTTQKPINAASEDPAGSFAFSSSLTLIVGNIAVRGGPAPVAAGGAVLSIMGL